jgi:PAS domain S-box-containing protein
MSVEHSPELAEALIAQLADGVIFADREGMIRVWNEGAEAIFGHPRAEAVGQSLDLIIPERLRPAHWAAFKRAIETGQLQHGRESLATRSMHRDGRTLYVDLSFALVRGRGGEVLGAVAVARDITRRFREERELRRRLAELEQGAAG